MNWVVVGIGWAVLLVAAGLLLGRAMRRADQRSGPGRHRAPPESKADRPPTPEPPAAQPPKTSGKGRSDGQASASEAMPFG